MKELKNIDRLFQEKFRDFEQTPSENVWENISTSLLTKTKRNNRVLWLWLSGVAAGFVLLFVLNNLSNNTDKPKYNTTGTNDTSIIKTEDPTIEVTHTDNKDILLDKTNRITNTKNKNNYRNNTTLSHTSVTNNNKLSSFKLENEVVNTTNTEPSLKKEVPFIYSKDRNNLAKNKSISTAKPKIATSNKNKTTDLKKLNQENNNKIATNLQEAIASNNTKKEEKTLLKDTVLSKTKDKDRYIAATTKKWTVSTTVAPVYFDAFDNTTSSFGKRFNKNTKQGQFSTAFGVQLAYQVNKRFSVQTGLHKVDYAYKTNEVYVSPNQFADIQKRNISLNNVINVKDFSAPPNQLGVEREIPSGSLMQVFGYYEIPLEIKYQLVKGKLGVDFVSGFSTLIRSKDEIYYQINDFSQKIDDTSNLNTVNLSGNIGLEANYRINKKVSFNVTPMFKVHVNTFTKESGKSNPYALGVYSGLNYRF